MIADALNFTFPDRLRLPLAFDPAGLADDLAGLFDVAWTEHFVTQNYDGDWSVIPLRAQAGATHPVLMIYPDPTATKFEDTQLLARLPHISEALAAIRCPLQTVRLMRLTPGSVIKEHSDHDLNFEHGVVRLHIPIATNPGVAFLLNRTPVTMAPGEVWYLRLSDPHSVVNRGAVDRVHLVVDACTNTWLETLFRKDSPS